MKEIVLGTTGKKMPAIVVGCMRLADKNCGEMQSFIHTALEQGAYFFAHADIYGGGQLHITPHIYSRNLITLLQIYIRSMQSLVQCS